jgi:hypothetical protein
MIQDWLARGVVTRRAGRWGLTDGAAELSGTVPASLHELIARQLAELAEADRRLLERASAAGLEFSAAALADSAAGVAGVERRCEALVERRLLLRRPEPARWPDGTAAAGYAFRHALYRRAISDAMPAHARGQLHLRVGRRLEKGHGRRAPEIAPVLADHFALGGDDRRAALYAHKAGETALLRGAARQAQLWLRRALSHIARWPSGRARDSQEIQTQINLGAAHDMIDGFGAAPAAAAFERALVLSRRVAESKTLVPILTGLFNYRVMTGNMNAASRLAARIHRLAQGQRDSGYRLVGDNALGYANWKLGRYAAALPLIEKVAAAYRVRRHAGLSTVFGEDPGIACRYYGAVTCIMLADRPAAERHLAAGMAVARAIRQPSAVAEILWAHCVVARECGDIALVGRRALELLALCEDGDLDYWRRPGRAFAAWVAAEQGDEAGVDRMGAVVQEWRETAMHSLHYMLALYAGACLKHGRLAAAGDVVAEGLALVRRTRESWFEAELHRLRGELALRQAAPAMAADAAACFRQAARIARRQGARLLELRALVSLADDCAARGRHVEALRLLEPMRPLFERAGGLAAATAARAAFARSRAALGR